MDVPILLRKAFLKKKNKNQNPIIKILKFLLIFIALVCLNNNF